MKKNRNLCSERLDAAAKVTSTIQYLVENKVMQFIDICIHTNLYIC